MNHMIECLNTILESPMSRGLPSSLVGCTALPLALHLCAVVARQKLQDNTFDIDYDSQSSARLRTLLQFLAVCQPVYDGVHWISRTIQYLMECTYFEDCALTDFKSSRDEQRSSTSETITSGSSISSILNDPSYYLRMALTVDISIREGRLPDEQDFPDDIRSLISRTGCFIPLLFETENDSMHQDESYEFLKTLGWSLQPALMPDDNLSWFIEQDRSLSFALEMGLGP